MMGRLTAGQGQLFYAFHLDEVVPADHVVRRIDAVLDLGWIHKELAPFYSNTGRPSTDSELMIRMLLVGYVFAIRSERRICAEVRVNLAYRWFCRLSIEDKIPDHSVFSRARHERFRESELFRRVFERVVATCMAVGLVGGEAFSIDASLIKADVDQTKRMSGDEAVDWPKPEEASRAIAEYLAALDAARVAEDGDDGDNDRKPPKQISLTDPQAAWVARKKMSPFFAYDANYLIDNKLGIIDDAEGTRANRSEETAVTETMIARVAGRYDLSPKRLAGDTAYGTGRLLRWLTDRDITPHIPVWDKSRQTSGRFTRDDFSYDKERNVYLCPGGKLLASTGNIDQGRILYYRALLNLPAEAPMRARAQGHARHRRGGARARPRAGQHRGLPTIAPRAQEGRDAVCPYEAHLEARPAAAAGLERRPRRGSARRHRPELEKACQVCRTTTADCASRLRCVSPARFLEDH